jgi:hypothetical protein
MAECALSLGNHPRDASEIAHVEFERNGAAAKRLNFRFKWREARAMAAGEHEIGAGLGQRAREILTETAAGAGDDCGATSEIEQFISGAIVGAGVRARALGCAHDRAPGASTTFSKLASRA